MEAEELLQGEGFIVYGYIRLALQKIDSRCHKELDPGGHRADAEPFQLLGAQEAKVRKEVVDFRFQELIRQIPL